MKPDWKDAPKWAKWLAQDLSGSWFWYSRKPEKGSTAWIVPDTGGCEISEVDNWGDTLEKRP